MLSLLRPLLLTGAIASVALAQLPAIPIDGPYEHHSWHYYECLAQGDRCKIVDLSFRTDVDVLRQCDSVRLDWSNGTAIPDNAGVSWEVDVRASYEGDVPPAVEAKLVNQTFVLPSTSLDWRVNYPEGTSLTFALEVYHENIYYRARSKAYSVQAAQEGAVDCVPSSYRPLLVTWPEQVTECGASLITWTGPQNLIVDATIQSGDYWHAELLEPKKRQDGVEGYGVVWDEPYPQGSEVYFSLRTADYTTWYTSRSYNIVAGKYPCYIPPRHGQGGKWEGRKGILALIIISSVVGGSAAIAGGAWVVWKYVLLPRRQGAVQLE
ncbi:hypothetical protein JCM8547_002525 [Rhodosporidiobolus lusitaniae]